MKPNEPKKDDDLFRQIYNKQDPQASKSDVTLTDFVKVYSVRDLLGMGAYGVVLKVKNKITNESSALKIIAKERLS
jgi:serine/threonine protein kinase